MNYFDKDAFDKFSLVITKNSDKMNESAMVNAISSFAHFDHRDSDCNEAMIRTIIKDASNYKLKSLASIIHSLACLEISDKTVFTII